LMSSNALGVKFIFILLNDMDEFRGLRQYILKVAKPNQY
jgi:hypothetical protein